MKGKKEFICDICNAEFVNKGTLKRHVATVHEGRKQFKCDICKIEFGQKGSLDQHVTVVHEGKKNSNVTFVMLSLDRRAI